MSSACWPPIFWQSQSAFPPQLTAANIVVQISARPRFCKHAVPAFVAIDKAGEQRKVIVHFRRLLSRRNIVFYDVLNCYPLSSRNSAFVFADCNDPFIHRLPRRTFLFIIAFVVGEKPIFIRTVFFSKQMFEFCAVK